MTVAKKATARSARKSAVSADVPKTVVVEGRKIAVKKPTVDQIILWNEIVNEMTKLKGKVDQIEEITLRVNQFHRITTGLFVNAEDKTWWDDGRFNGIISLEDESVLSLVNGAAEAYGDEIEAAANRAERRAVERKKV